MMMMMMMGILMTMMPHVARGVMNISVMGHYVDDDGGGDDGDDDGGGDDGGDDCGDGSDDGDDGGDDDGGGGDYGDGDHGDGDVDGGDDDGHVDDGGDDVAGYWWGHQHSCLRGTSVMGHLCWLPAATWLLTISRWAGDLCCQSSQTELLWLISLLPT